MAASNTQDCFRECIGKTIVGVLFNACPHNRADLKSGNKTLVFDDRTGLTISASGTFWQESEREIRRAVEILQAELGSNDRLIRDVLETAGALG